MITEQMKALKKELKEREIMSRQLALEQSLISEDSTSTRLREGEGGGGGAVMAEAVKFIKSERQRVATRIELTR